MCGKTRIGENVRRLVSLSATVKGMTYDFYLFEPDRDDTGAIVHYSRRLSGNPTLVARFQRESAATTDAIEQATEVIREKISDVNTNYDRTVVVPVAYGKETHIEPWLREVAIAHGLGLASDGDLVICYGDEDPRFKIEGPWLSKPAASRSGILADLKWIEQEAPNNQFLILWRVGDGESFVQSRPDGAWDQSEEGWDVEIHEDGWGHNDALRVPTAEEVAKIMRLWMDNDPALGEYPWEKLVL